MLDDIIYKKGYDDLVNWAFIQLDMVSNICPNAIAFITYMNRFWQAKIPLWCVGVLRIPHAGISTNGSQHSNLKNFFHFTKEKF